MYPDPNKLLIVPNGENKRSLAPTTRQLLIVDSDKRSHEIHPLCQPLLQCGYQITHLLSAREALAHLRYVSHSTEITSPRPALVICDLFLPDADGLDFVQEVRSFQKLSGYHTPILLVATIESNPTFEQAVVDMGADDFIVKPVRPSDLLLRVRRLLRGLPGVVLEHIESTQLEKRRGRELQALPVNQGNSPFRALRKDDFDFE